MSLVVPRIFTPHESFSRAKDVAEARARQRALYNVRLGASLRRFFPKTERNPRSQVHWPTSLSRPLGAFEVPDRGRTEG